MANTRARIASCDCTVELEGPHEFVAALLEEGKPVSALISGVVAQRSGASMCDAPNDELTSVALEHAWAWFSLHADQRMKSVNFFLIAAAFLSNAFVLAVRSSAFVPAVAVAILGVLVAVLFDRLEQRVRELLKAAERAIRPLEASLGDRLSNDNLKLVDLVETPAGRIWPYSKTFRWLFYGTGVTFFGGVLYAAWHCWATATSSVPSERTLIALVGGVSCVGFATRLMLFDGAIVPAKPRALQATMAFIVGVFLSVAGVSMFVAGFEGIIPTVGGN